MMTTTSVRFQGAYCLTGSKAAIQEMSDLIAAKAAQKKKPLPVAFSDYAAQTPYPDTTYERYLYTGKDAEKYTNMLPLMRLYRKASHAFRDIVFQRAQAIQASIVKQIPVMESVYEMSLRPPKDWVSFESRAIEKCQFINLDEVNLKPEIENGNFNLRSGRFKTNPPTHRNFQYKDLDPIGKSEINMALAISPEEPSS